MASDIELVQRAFIAFRRRDVDGLLATCAPDIVFEPVTARLAGRSEPYRGHDGLRQYLRDVATVWQELRPMPEVFHRGEGGVVVVTGRIYAWAKGRVVDAPAGWLWRIDERGIVYGRIFESPAAALEAAGLEVT